MLNAVVIYHKYENLDLVYYLAASLANVVCSLSVLVDLQKDGGGDGVEPGGGVGVHLGGAGKAGDGEKQYEISKQTIDLINVKCHDMKHQIRAISRQAAIDPAALEEMESVISIYGTIVKTGSQALDIILAEKNLSGSRGKRMFTLNTWLLAWKLMVPPYFSTMSAMLFTPKPW